MTTIQGLESITLSNGLNVTLMPNPAEVVFSFCLTVPAGARTDPCGQTGLAHFLEHCYALGTGTFAPRQIDLVVERAGGVRGAFTTQDVTHHVCTMPRATLPATIRNEADRFAALALPADEVADEREVVLQEGIQRMTRSAGGALVHRLLAAAFDRHPYRNPVVGWPHDVKRLSRDDLRTCYRAHYRPANAAITLTGGFDPDRARDLIEKYFGNADAGTRPVIEPAPEPEQTVLRRESFFHPNARTPRRAILWKVPSLDHPDTASLMVLEAALQLAEPSLRVKHWLLRDRGPFTVDFEAEDLSHVDAQTERVEALIADFASNGLREERLVMSRKVAKANISSGLICRTDSAAQILARFQATSRSGIARLRELSDQLDTVAGEDVARVAALDLAPERATSICMLPA